MQLQEADKKSDHDESGPIDGPIRLRGHKLSLTCICVDSKNKFAYSGSKDGSIVKWCLSTMKIAHKINSINKQEFNNDKSKRDHHHTRHVSAIAISSDDRFLATGGWDKLIRIWSAKNMSHIHTFKMHRDEITALTFRIGHPTLYSGSADRSLMLWTLEDDDNRCLVEALYGHESPITSIDSLKRERVITSGGRDQTIRVWKIVEQAQTVFESKHESVDITKFIDDKTFVTGGEDGALRIWSTMKRSPVFTLENAHKSNKKQEVSTGTIDNPKLSFWITSIAVFSLKPKSSAKVVKKRKLGSGNETPTRQDSEDDEDDEQEDDDQSDADDATGDLGEKSNQGNNLALIASGSCDSIIRIWILTKSGGKYHLKPEREIECVGFVNDLCFTQNGSKLLAACGQEHRFGRWWKLRRAKNCIRVFDINKS